MTNILKRLQYLDFPDSTREALQYLVKCFSSQGGGSTGIPGLGGGAENFAVEVSQEYVLFKSSKKGFHKKLSAVHELQLLEMLCSCLQDAPEGTRYNIFSVIFCGKVDETKMSLLTKLVSMALSVSCGAVLDCAALWMQEQGCHSPAVCNLAQKIVEDYCLLFPDSSATFQRLPSVSTLFSCNFITAVATIYTFRDQNSCPPLGLLEYVTDWISTDPCLCSESVRLVRIHSEFSCPFPGIVNWCILGPLICHDDSKSSLNKTVSETSVKISCVLAKLHLSVLQSLQAYRSMELNQVLFSIKMFSMLAQTLLHLYHSNKTSEDEEVLNACVDKLGQVIQVAIVTGSLRIVSGQNEIRKICDLLPPNRLLQMVCRQHERQTVKPMDIS